MSKAGDADKTGAGLSKRRFLGGLGATGLASMVWRPGAAEAAVKSGRSYDVIIVGAGSTGMPAAIFAAQRGAKVLLIEAASVYGGTLFLSTGQISGAGTKLQKSKGIEDTPQAFFDDVMRIGGGTADPSMLRLFVENSAETTDWLIDNGLEPQADHPVVGGGHEPYLTPRYFWAKEGGLAVLAVFDTLLQREIARGKVTLLVNTQARALIRNFSTGAVIGIAAATGDAKPVEYYGRNVVLASGGYGSNGEMFERYEGMKHYADAVYPYSQGAGTRLALEAGASMRGKECRQPLFNAVLADKKIPSPILLRITSNPQLRPPWEIFVNSHGKRFFPEDVVGFDIREKALKQQPMERCWIVFDDAILDAAPSICRTWTKDKIRAAFDEYPTFYRSGSLADLAKAAGIDEAGLIASVDDYNRGQKDGQDSLGRTHLPLPIVKPPYYAIEMQGYYLVDAAGLRVDTSLRVLGANGKPIPNLYAAGEILGYGQMQGAGYSGGMALSPTITFGRMLGQSILKI